MRATTLSVPGRCPAYRVAVGTVAHRAPVCVAGLLVVLLALPYFRPGGWDAVREYDDGVHLASAIALVHGQLPYRDFAFLQPPGITLALTPFAAVAGVVGQPVAMLLARVAVMGCALLSLVLLWRLGRGPHAWRVVVIALFAVSSDVLIAERTVLLEPLIGLSALAGLSVLARRGPSSPAALCSGVLFGLGIEVKLFAVALPLGVCVALGSRLRWRAMLIHLAAAAGTVAALSAPFLVLAPGAAWRDVVLTQLTRPADGLQGVDRLTSALGMHGWRLGAWQVSAIVLILAAAAWCSAAACADLVGSAAVTALIVTVAAFTFSASFFDHYGAFPLTLAAIVLARARLTKPALAVTALPLALLLVVQASGTVADERRNGSSTSIRTAARAVGLRGCTFSDSVSLAIAADRYRPATAACPGWIDGRGYALTLRGDRPSGYYPYGFRTIRDWQDQLLHQLTRADTLLLTRNPRLMPEWSAPVTQYVTRHFTLRARSVQVASWQIWTRT